MASPLFSAANVKALRLQARAAMEAKGHFPVAYWVSVDTDDVFKALKFLTFCQVCHARVTVNVTTLSYDGVGLLPCTSLRTVVSDIGDILISGFTDT